MHQEALQRFYGTNYPRLVDCKMRYDSDNLFHHNFNIRSTAAEPPDFFLPQELILPPTRSAVPTSMTSRSATPLRIVHQEESSPQPRTWMTSVRAAFNQVLSPAKVAAVDPQGTPCSHHSAPTILVLRALVCQVTY